ncbi:hypothetical protein [Kaistella montana]|uniref:DUF4348 domain-containing protein n=1 Tax=Kaistella montana TaxID=1849733 RepID=A0ABW5K4L8_9FLAO|nr:hypothetical protein [Kaistella montana]MCQ4034180.1 hypothetical protein [Kaistella montana]
MTLFLLGISFVQAQLTVTTNLREDGVWNKDKMIWDITSTEEGLTVFNFDKNLSSFRHITNSMTSVYTIKDWDYDEKEVLYEMQVQSDAGNDYDFLIDGINEVVIFFYHDKDGNYRMVRHVIKDTNFQE